MRPTLVRRVGRPNLRPALRHLPRQHRGEGPGRRDRARTSARSTTSTSRRTTAARRARATSRGATTFKALKAGRLRRLVRDRGVRPRAAGARGRDAGLARLLPSREEVYRSGTISCARNGPRPDTDKHTGERHMKSIKGPAIFLAQFAGDERAVQHASTPSAAGPPRSATRACRSRPGTAACSTSRRRPRAKTYCDEVKGTAAEHGVEITELVDPPAGPARRGPPGLRRGASTRFAPAEVRGNPKARQEWAVEQVKLAAQASPQSRPRRARHLLRRACLALPLSLAAAAAGPDRHRLRRAGAALEADPRRLSTRPASTSATSCIRARTCSTARPSRCSSSASAATSAAASTTTRRTSCCRQLDYLEFIDIYHERIKAFHVKDAEFNPTGRQGVYSRLPGLARTAPAASARSATARSTSAASSRSSRIRLRQLGGARMGVLPQAPGGRRARRAPIHQAATSSA